MIITALIVRLAIPLIILGTLVFFYVWNNSKQQDRHDQLVSAIEKSNSVSLEITETFQKIADTAGEFNSLKRWMREMITQLEKHSATLEATTVRNEGIVKINEIKTADVSKLATMVEEMQKSGAVVVTDHLEDVAARLRPIIKEYGHKESVENDEYMRGMYNGTELFLSYIEKRDPNYIEK